MNSTLHLVPALRYVFKEVLRTGAIVFGVGLTAIVWIVGMLSLLAPDELGSVSSISTIILTFAFICGLCIRSDLRIFIQHGIGRRTAFVAELISTVVLAAIFAGAAELTTFILQTTLGATTGFTFFELYQSIYLVDTLNQNAISLGEHLMSALFIFSLYCLLYIVGVFISMVYYRINKILTIVLSIGVPLLVLSFISFGTATPKDPLVDIMLNPSLAITCFIILALVFTALSWILVRRVNIRAVGA